MSKFLFSLQLIIPKLLISMMAIAVVWAWLFGLGTVGKQIKEHQSLLQDINKLKPEDYKSVTYLSGKGIHRGIACYKFNRGIDVKEIVSKLSSAVYVGHLGHVGSVKEARLVLTDHNDKDHIYIIAAYGRIFVDDAFVAMNPWTKTSNGNYTQEVQVPVRVPGFNKWLLAKFNSNIMVNC